MPHIYIGGPSGILAVLTSAYISQLHRTWRLSTGRNSGQRRAWGRSFPLCLLHLGDAFHDGPLEITVGRLESISKIKPQRRCYFIRWRASVSMPMNINIELAG